MNFYRNKKIIFIVLLVFVILFVGEIKFAHAGIGTNVIMGIAQAIAYLLGYIAGLFLSLCGWLVKLALEFNLTLLASPIIQTGWQIVLNFTNLGFVLAIIIIAFATIFRVQSYAMKQTLGKLIAAALLVNFSLVIAGAFINVSDIFSNFFLKQGGIEHPEKWADAFSGIFQAQKLLEVSSEQIALQQGGLALTQVSNLSAGTLALTAAPFFIALFTALAAITLFAVFIMLLIRYVYLGVLLILSPIVWLLWIFPGTANLWQRWWKNFISWTFFAPIMLFFMSLAIYAMANEPEAVKQMVAANPKTSAEVNLTFGAGVIGEMMIAIGLVMGGLMAAKEMSITFSSTAMGWAQGMGKQFGGWVGRKGVRLGTAPLRTKAGRGAIDWMQNRGLGKGRFGRVMASPIRYFGEAMSGLGVRQGEQLVADAEKRVGAFKTDKSLADAFSTLPREQQIAAAKRLTKNKTMNLMNEKDLNYYIGKEGTKKSFARFGAENVYNDFEKAAVRNTKMVQAKTPEEKEEAAKEFHKTFKPKDYENVRIKAFTEDKEYAKSNIIGMMSSDPGALSKLFPKLSGKDLDTSNPESFYSKVKQHYSDLKGNFDENIDKFIHTIDATIDIGSSIGIEAEKKLAWLKARGITEAGFREENNKLNNVYNLITRNLTKRFEQFAPPEEHTPPTETA